MSKGERGSAKKGKKKSKKAELPDYSSMPLHARAVALVEATGPLLELFATLDAVFTEDDALTEMKKVSLGRCYEGWKRARAALDPSFDPDERPRRRAGTPRVFSPSREQVEGMTG